MTIAANSQTNQDLIEHLLEQDLCAQSRAIELGEVSADALRRAQYQRLQALQPALHAVINLAPLDSMPINHGPLANLPVGVKDNIDVAGMVTSCGMQVYAEAVARKDAPVVRLLRSIGLWPAAKLNMHEGALGATNHNSWAGDCQNPWQLGYTAGGSSGGSAAAVASTMLAAALGSDTMGSVRVPASYCGLFAYKPGKSMITNDGSVACCHSLDSIGPLTRSARDLALLGYTLLGDDLDPDLLKPEAVSPLQGKRLLVPTDLASMDVSSDILADFTAALTDFQALGAEIVPVSLSEAGLDAEALGKARRAGLLLCERDMLRTHADVWQQQRSALTPYLQSMLGYGESKSNTDEARARQQLKEVADKVNTLLSLGDFLLMPTTPQRAFPLTDPVPANQADLTCLANIAGVPAINLPMPTSQALPAGMQILNKRGEDRVLLTLALHWQQQSGFVWQLPNAVKALLQPQDTIQAFHSACRDGL